MAEELEWVFDSLVEFLRGPVWNIPILTFIEQKSVVFEPGAGNVEEFKKIHDEYKNLVDFMLGSYMEDLNISPEQFERACTVASKKALTQFHQNLFEQVWAADDFEIFRRMMTQKNLELQLQALEVLAQRYGLAPDFMEPGPNCKPSKEEENIMKEVLRRTMEENSDPPPMESKAHDDHPHSNAIKATLAEKSRLEAERRKEKELLDQAVKLSLLEIPAPDGDQEASSSFPAPPLPPPPPTDAPSEPFPIAPSFLPPVLSPLPPPPAPRVEEKKMTPEERPWSEGDEKVYVNTQVSITPLDVERRQSYLRQQRDRLLSLKRQERTKHLAKYEETSMEKRPRSARAARKVLREEEHDVDPETLAFRRSLASRLRSEVVDKSI